MGHESLPTHWAILIGVGMSVDARPAAPSDSHVVQDQSLRGPVHDVEMMGSYFRGDPHVKISKLTATKPSDGSNSNIPLEHPDSLPTKRNIECLLKDVIKEGASRHIKYVYIHFSGHGTRLDDGTLALSVYDYGLLGRARFYTQHLATALTKMTKQGMHVTLVLDCCFSGSVKRSHATSTSQLRFIHHEVTEDLNDLDDPFLEGDEDILRASSLKMQRTLDPDGYLVIAGCGPDELSWEVEMRNGQRHGVLSYFLHDSLATLNKAGTQVSFETLFNRLSTKLHVNYPNQTPRHYGHISKSFFLKLSCKSNRYLVPILKISKPERFVLQAGKAHGVHQGDEYEAYPYYASEATKTALRQEFVLLRVSKVENLDSEIAPVDNDQLKRLKSFSTWKAKVVTSQSDRKTLIHLSSTLRADESDKLRKYLPNNPFLTLLEYEEQYDLSTFNVRVSEDEFYEIHQGDYGPALHAPRLPRSNEDSLEILSDTLGHIATFKFFEGIENTSLDQDFEKSLRIETLSTMGSTGWFDIKDKGNFEFSIANLDKRPLYLTAFNLRSSWEVCNMMSEAGLGSSYQVPMEDGKMSFPIPMEIPDSVRVNGGAQNEDIIKVFISDQKPYFPFIVLPKLGEGGNRRSHELTKFLDSLEGSYRDSGHGTKGRWTTRTFLIRTYTE
ncbi:unnamed protein product [Fusarium graminearum]|nr:hypothetical protein FG05_30018 [Fusarium graminearum]CAF3478407.1 unnamed protein product [Fusarium graminearum]